MQWPSSFNRPSLRSCGKRGPFPVSHSPRRLDDDDLLHHIRGRYSPSLVVRLIHHVKGQIELDLPDRSSSR